MLKQRIQKVIEKMSKNQVNQMLISDSAAIFYLTGIWVHPGERFLALYINDKEEQILFNNELFPLDSDISIVWYNDTEEPIDKVVPYLREGTLGVDKNLPAKFLLKLMDKKEGVKYINGSILVDSVRMIKDETEKELMRIASKINDQAIDQLKTKLYEGITEKQVVGELQKIYEDLGAEGFSFKPIIAFGGNAANPHHSSGNSKLQKGDAVIIDIGCVKNSYCSDMTRTVFFQEVSEKGQKVYNIVKEAQQKAIEAIKPGVKFSEVDFAARNHITKAGYGQYFTHRTGHNIGIEVHDYGDVSAVNHDLLQEGQIFSIEPGIYLRGEVGVRIEDLVIVTADGCENLNKASKELQIIK